MHLKEIQLENFKSFGRKMTVPFLEGFTAITGPNGSGKSNIADAIMFVLGPKSPKSIRAGRLTDLIFNGGKGGRPEKYCKVSLVFDNQDRLIPIDNDEVKLTRMVKLSQSNKDNYNSYFYVNGRSSSLTEFNDLLANAKISADGYNFVMQGDINAITRMSPLERRRILEDVAGITRFDKDIDLSERKRTDVEENLRMIQLTLNEIGTELRRLEKDRKSAIKYREYNERLETSKAYLAHKKVDTFEREIAAVQEQTTEYETELEEGKKRVEELRATLAEVTAEFEKIEAEIVEKGGDEARELKAKIDEARLEIARAKDAIITSKERVREMKVEKASAAKDLATLTKDLKRMGTEADAVRKDHEARKKDLDAKRKEYESFQRRLADSDSETANHQKQLIRLSKEAEKARDDAHHATLEVERLNERKSTKLKTLADSEERMRLMDTTIKDADWRLKEIRGRMGGSGEDLDDARKKVYALKKEETTVFTELEQVQGKVRELEREYTRLKTEKDVYRQSRHGAVDALMEARDLGQLKGIFGTISQLADVDEEYEVALSVAAGSRMNAVVVENDAAAEAGISYLKKNRLGRVAFLPLNKMMTSKPQGKCLLAARDGSAIGFAIDLVSYDAKYQKAFEWVFGSTVVVKDLKSARKLMGGVRLVTMSGELIESSGAMIGGTLHKPQKFGAGRQAEVEDVSARLREQSTLMESLAEKLRKVREELHKYESIMHDSHVDDEDIRAAKELEMEIKTASEESKKLKDAVIKLKEEIKAIDAEIAVAREKVEGLDGVLAKIDERRKAEHKMLVDSTPEEVVAAMRKLENEMNELADAARELASSEATINTKVELHTERADELTERLATIDDDMSETAKEGEDAKVRVDKLKEELDVLLEVESGIASEMKGLQEARDRTYKRKVDLDNELDSTLTQIETKEDLLIGLRTKSVNLKTQLSEAKQEATLYNIELPESLPTVDELRKEITECEARIRALGAVNMRAVEDFEVYDKRRKEIEAEFQRLEDQRTHLIQVVEELISKKKAGLMAVFDEVNVNFTKIYKELSLGGDGHLELENPKNPFEGGLMIIAKPPGKRVKKLVQLSGGEKSLTALALIFAIQKYDPSPFYLLDEVDMFLDAVNAERVAKLVAGTSERAQFIMITLRKVTMGHADHAYGVTMGEKGISELIGNVHISQIGEKGEIAKEERPVEEPVGGDAVA